MGRRRTLAVLVTVLLGATLGCQSLRFWGGGEYAGPYTVKVVDASTGLGVAGAMVEWETYFTATDADPQELTDRGAEPTGPSGALIIQRVTRAGGRFRELDLRVRAPLYVDAKQQVGYTTGRVTVVMTPIAPTGLLP